MNERLLLDDGNHDCLHVFLLYIRGLDRTEIMVRGSPKCDQADMTRNGNIIRETYLSYLDVVVSRLGIGVSLDSAREVFEPKTYMAYVSQARF